MAFSTKNFPFHFDETPGKNKKGKANILLCPECNAAYWFKSWHHSLDEYPNLKEDSNIKMAICPACKIQKEGKYQGELILENIPSDRNEEIKNLIAKFGSVAFQNDPMDRIINVDQIARGMIRVLTTENQMVTQLAKKIKRTYKGKINIIHSKKDVIIRMRVVFPGL